MLKQERIRRMKTLNMFIYAHSETERTMHFFVKEGEPHNLMFFKNGWRCEITLYVHPNPDVIQHYVRTQFYNPLTKQKFWTRHIQDNLLCPYMKAYRHMTKIYNAESLLPAIVAAQIALEIATYPVQYQNTLESGVDEPGNTPMLMPMNLIVDDDKKTSILVVIVPRLTIPKLIQHLHTDDLDRLCSWQEFPFETKEDELAYETFLKTHAGFLPEDRKKQIALLRSERRKMLTSD